MEEKRADLCSLNINKIYVLAACVSTRNDWQNQLEDLKSVSCINKESFLRFCLWTLQVQVRYRSKTPPESHIGFPPFFPSCYLFLSFSVKIQLFFCVWNHQQRFLSLTLIKVFAVSVQLSLLAGWLPFSVHIWILCLGLENSVMQQETAALIGCRPEVCVRPVQRRSAVQSAGGVGTASVSVCHCTAFICRQIKARLHSNCPQSPAGEQRWLPPSIVGGSFPNCSEGTCVESKRKKISSKAKKETCNQMI